MSTLLAQLLESLIEQPLESRMVLLVVLGVDEDLSHEEGHCSSLNIPGLEEGKYDVTLF